MQEKNEKMGTRIYAGLMYERRRKGSKKKLARCL